MKSFLLSSLCIVMLAISACSESPRQNPRELSEEEQNIDKIISEASFQDLEGNAVQVSDFAGKVVLIDFWETWCGPCLQVFPAMDSLQNEYPEDFVVIAVNLNDSDSPEDVEDFKEGNEYDFVYTIDNENVGNQIIKLGIPFKVFVDPEGYLITTELGSSGTEGDYRKAKEIIEQNKTS
ncbi:TlpA family protein disulfide reductase [Gracilimonas mengyeensis]|uniref:Thiol-disulfide isomerase or thioredoxin n=1 Tax=Gracilimonas mengyeensis TaxID=1302730 RepID=A0A521EGN5_9BACT|nr:TlpA disulfide reductase family protein [Gracilimonas mengyeensis]SMO83068.1 Thiol-disulfide isomerase or thioredoxin [Gracilimonas mengyeensis]